ncbi:MAG: RluA family pseudouridine synthase [Enterococcus sp.]|nr:RluA family pseudouridine synthase [Enterococcus sp.]
MKQFVIEKNDAGQRLDRFLKKYLRNASLSYIYKAIRRDIKVNGKRQKPDSLILEGDEITFYIADDEFTKLTQKNDIIKICESLNIAFENEHVLIVDKPVNLLVHGDKSEKKRTLSNLVISYLAEKGYYSPRAEKSFVPGPVNRIDRNTSGLVIFGKTAHAIRLLNEIVKDKGEAVKEYLAVTSGDMLKGYKKGCENPIVCQKPIMRNGRLLDAKTVFYPIESKGEKTLVLCRLFTGRTHQIRIHLTSLGFPVLGDNRYGKEAVPSPAGKNFGQYLYAYRLSFNGERSKELGLDGKVIEGTLPKEFADLGFKMKL